MPPPKDRPALELLTKSLRNKRSAPLVELTPDMKKGPEGGSGPFLMTLQSVEGGSTGL